MHNLIIDTLREIEALPAMSGHNYELLKAKLDSLILGHIYPGRNEVDFNKVDAIAREGYCITLTRMWSKYTVQTSKGLIEYE
jgi:hypothetical protein